MDIIISKLIRDIKYDQGGKKMKKKIVLGLLLGGFTIYAWGCGTGVKDRGSETSVNQNVLTEDSEGQTEEAFAGDKAASTETDIAPTETPAGTPTDTAGEAEGKQEDTSSGKKVSAATEIDMVSLPEGIKGMKAESKPYPELAQLISDYYEIPEEFADTTRYYYNYVDLNNDGENEILVVVMGPYTSGSGGSSALWVTENAGKLHVNQDFTIVNTPVIISDTVTNGAKEIVVPYYGGGAESQYSLLKCVDDYYTRVPDGKMIKSLDGITGTAIIANDIPKEIEAGIMGLNLAQ
jgi:hypothetical protein